MRKIIAIMMVVGLSSTLFAQTPIEKASKHFDLKAYDLAAQAYLDILKTYPDSADILIQLADCYYFTNDHKNALTYYLQADKLGKLTPKAGLRLAHTFMKSGDYENAEKRYLQYAEHDEAIGNHYASNCQLAVETAQQPSFYNVKREYLNTSADDFGPAFFGNRIVYASARKDISRKATKKNGANWSGKAYAQLFNTALDSKGYLQKPKHLRGDLRFDYQEGPVAYHPQENTVVITKNNFVSGHSLASNLQSEMTLESATVLGKSGDWEGEKTLPFAQGDYNVGFASFSPDGKKLYFSSNQPGGEGGYDIYVSEYDAGTWSPAKNIGSPINTPGDEITAYENDGVLFFSSNWLPGLGGFDVFRAETGTTAKWSRVFHMGTGINSSQDDYGFIFNAKKNIGYFTSNRRGPSKGDDIYKTSKTSDKIEILVINASDGKPLNGATIDFSACGESALKTNAYGKSAFQALAGLDCDAVIEKTGYKPYTLKVTSSGNTESKKFTVKLTQSDEEYIGKVVDNETNEPMELVLITATSAEGESLKTFTGPEGEFTLALKPKTTYDIIYSKAEFSDVTKSIDTKDGKVRTILGIQPMLNAYTGTAFVEKGPKPIPMSETAAIPAEETETEAELKARLEAEIRAKIEAEKAEDVADSQPAVEIIEKAKETTKVKDKSPTNTLEKYAIQVAAYVDDGKSINMSKYKSLFEYGNVYSRPSGKHVKIRVGVFDSRAEASTHLKKIKASGFKQAFVTKETIQKDKKTESDLLIKKSAEAPKKVEKPAPAKAKPATSKPEAAKPTASKKQYFVQLAAYANSKISYFKESKVSHLGKIVRKKGSKYTTIYIQSDSLEEAVHARKEAMGLGYNRPYVVFKENGKFVRMKF